MEDEKLVVSPKMKPETRDKINILTHKIHFKRASDTTDFLFEVFERLTTGMDYENKEDVLTFLENLLRDKKELAEENRQLIIWKKLIKEELRKMIND